MKANELMIGDWVYSAFAEYPCQVEGIEWIEIGYAFVKISGVDGYKCIESLSPIPLTKEILEKNGFEEYDGAYIYYTAHYDDCINLCGTILKIGNDKGNMELADVRYVHELQHALRLCNIDKTIEL